MAMQSYVGLYRIVISGIRPKRSEQFLQSTLCHLARPQSLQYNKYIIIIEVEVHKNAKREFGQYPAVLTELAWSIKDLLYGIKKTEKNDLRTCLFSSNEKEASYMQK